MALWTNGDLMVAIISLLADGENDPRVILEESVTQIVQSVATFDPATSIEFVPGWGGNASGLRGEPDTQLVVARGEAGLA